MQRPLDNLAHASHGYPQPQAITEEPSILRMMRVVQRFDGEFRELPDPADSSDEIPVGFKISPIQRQRPAQQAGARVERALQQLVFESSGSEGFLTAEFFGEGHDIGRILSVTPCGQRGAMVHADQYLCCGRRARTRWQAPDSAISGRASCGFVCKPGTGALRDSRSEGATGAG